MQLAASAGKKVVGALAALDVKLEEVGVLPKLTPQPVPEDVADEDGQMHNDRMEVRLQAVAQGNRTLCVRCSQSGGKQYCTWRTGVALGHACVGGYFHLVHVSRLSSVC